MSVPKRPLKDLKKKRPKRIGSGSDYKIPPEHLKPRPPTSKDLMDPTKPKSKSKSKSKTKTKRKKRR